VTAPAERPLLLISGAACTQPLWPGLAERYDLVDPDLQEHIANQAVTLAARVVGGMDTVTARVATAYPERAPDALNGHLGDWFPGFAHHLLGGAVAVLAQLERLAGMGGRIAGCVTHEDVSLDTRALVNWCNARGIPTLHVPHAPCHLLPGVTDIHRQTRPVARPWRASMLSRGTTRPLSP
jgi:hypothetical protein